MSNMAINVSNVDGSGYCLHELGEPCKLAIHTLFTDDFAAPPLNMTITVKTLSGEVKVIIPYDQSLAVVMLNDERL